MDDQPNNIPKATPLSYIAATVLSNESVFILSQVDELVTQQIDHTKVLRWKNDQWAHFMIDWPTTHICRVPSDVLTLLCLGLHGKVYVAAGRDRFVEEIDITAEGPLARGVLRDLRLIEGRPVVAGMQRQAYVRVAPGRWERMDQGMVEPVGSKAICGFNSIDGFSLQEMYAVGIDGEMWRRDGSEWIKIDSPTSVALQKVVCVPTGDVYVSGQAGVLLRGRFDGWGIIDDKSITEPIWDLCWFKDRLFVAGSRFLMYLDGTQLVPVIVPRFEAPSFGALATNGQVLWSIGQKTLAYTNNGDDWVEVSCDDGAY